MLALLCYWLFWVAGAALLGFLLAWLLKGSKVNEWKSKWEAGDSSYRSLKSNHDGYVSKFDKLNSKYNKLKASNDTLNKEAGIYKSKVVKLEEKLSLAGNGVATNTVQIKEVDNSYEIRSLESKIERIERDVAFKNEEIERLNNENENFATKMEVLELTTEEAKKEKDKAIANIKKYEEYRPRFEQANLERNTLKYKYEQLLAVKGGMSDNADQAQNEKAGLEEEIATLKTSAAQSDNQTKALQLKVTELEEVNNKAAKQYGDVKTKYDSLLKLQERTEEKIKAIESAPSAQPVVDNSAADAEKAKNDALAKENAELKAALEQQKAKAEDNSAADAEKTKNDALSKENAELKAALEQQKAKAEDNSAADAEKAKNDALAKENAELKAALEQQKAKVNDNSAADAEKAKADALAKENAELKAALEQQKAKAAAAIVAAPAKKKPVSKAEKEAKASAAKEQLSAAIGSKIKRATAAEKDDLQKISGVGPFMEKKLNDLGIYTFEQVSQLDGELIQIVTDAIQFFPGRITRDDWVGQATSLKK